MGFTNKFQELQVDYDKLYESDSYVDISSPDGWLSSAKLQYVMQLNNAIAARKKEMDVHQSIEEWFANYWNSQYEKDYYSLDNIEEGQSLEEIALQRFQNGESEKIILTTLSSQLAKEFPSDLGSNANVLKSNIQEALKEYNFSEDLAWQITTAILSFDEDGNILGYMYNYLEIIEYGVIRYLEEQGYFEDAIIELDDGKLLLLSDAIYSFRYADQSYKAEISSLEEFKGILFEGKTVQQFIFANKEEFRKIDDFREFIYDVSDLSSDKISDTVSNSLSDQTSSIFYENDFKKGLLLLSDDVKEAYKLGVEFDVLKDLMVHEIKALISPGARELYKRGLATFDDLKQYYAFEIEMLTSFNARRMYELGIARPSDFQDLDDAAIHVLISSNVIETYKLGFVKFSDLLKIAQIAEAGEIEGEIEKAETYIFRIYAVTSPRAREIYSKYGVEVADLSDLQFHDINMLTSNDAMEMYKLVYEENKLICEKNELASDTVKETREFILSIKNLGVQKIQALISYDAREARIHHGIQTSDLVRFDINKIVELVSNEARERYSENIIKFSALAELGTKEIVMLLSDETIEGCERGFFELEDLMAFDAYKMFTLTSEDAIKAYESGHVTVEDLIKFDAIKIGELISENAVIVCQRGFIKIEDLMKLDSYQISVVISDQAIEMYESGFVKFDDFKVIDTDVVEAHDENAIKILDVDVIDALTSPNAKEAYEVGFVTVNDLKKFSADKIDSIVSKVMLGLYNFKLIEFSDLENLSIDVIYAITSYRAMLTYSGYGIKPCDLIKLAHLEIQALVSDGARLAYEQGFVKFLDVAKFNSNQIYALISHGARCLYSDYNISVKDFAGLPLERIYALVSNNAIVAYSYDVSFSKLKELPLNEVYALTSDDAINAYLSGIIRPHHLIGRDAAQINMLVSGGRKAYESSIKFSEGADAVSDDIFAPNCVGDSDVRDLNPMIYHNAIERKEFGFESNSEDEDLSSYTSSDIASLGDISALPLALPFSYSDDFIGVPAIRSAIMMFYNNIMNKCVVIKLDYSTQRVGDSLSVQYVGQIYVMNLNDLINNEESRVIPYNTDNTVEEYESDISEFEEYSEGIIAQAEVKLQDKSQQEIKNIAGHAEPLMKTVIYISDHASSFARALDDLYKYVFQVSDLGAQEFVHSNQEGFEAFRTMSNIGLCAAQIAQGKNCILPVIDGVLRAARHVDFLAHLSNTSKCAVGVALNTVTSFMLSGGTVYLPTALFGTAKCIAEHMEAPTGVKAALHVGEDMSFMYRIGTNDIFGQTVAAGSMIDAYYTIKDEWGVNDLKHSHEF